MRRKIVLELKEESIVAWGLFHDRLVCLNSASPQLFD